MSEPTVAMTRCGDCDEWALPPLGDDDLMRLVGQSALLIHAFLSHADKVQERTGLKSELIGAVVDAAAKQMADDDPELDGLSGADFDAVGRAWGAMHGAKRAAILRRMTPVGVRLLREVGSMAKEYAMRVQAAAS